MSIRRVAVLLAFGLIVVGTQTAWGQTASQFPQGATNWVGTSGDLNNGDRDQTVVLFFELPDTTAGTIYFGIDNPGNSGTASQFDQSGSAGTSYWYLIGGSGALSDPSSQLITYTPYPSSQPLAGNILGRLTRVAQNESWVYFPGVTASQGEHIGNKYYFKVVLQVDPNVGKNSFQADVSSSNAGAPAFITGARSFAFGWSPFMSSNTAGSGRTFDFYPFVGSGSTGSLSVDTWDFDNAVTSATTFNIAGASQGSFTPAGTSAQAAAPFPLGGSTNGTWHVNVVGAQGGTTSDLVELWNTLGSANLRTYAAAIAAQTPDHVTLTYNGGTLPTGGSGQATIQIVDSSGNPCLIGENVWVSVGGSAQINAASDSSTTLPAKSALVTTDGNGLGWVGVTDTSAEIATVSATTNGANGSSSLPGANNSVNLVFSLAPSLSSASSSSFAAAGTQALPLVTISDNSSALTSTANGIYIRVPASIGLPFSTAVPVITGTASGKVTGTSYPTSSILRLTLNAALSGSDTIILSGLQLVVPSGWLGGGSLQLSFDGGITYPVSDPQTITVNTVGTYSWSGAGGNNNWTNAANWTGGIVPPANADVLIPTGMPRQPTVDTGIPAMHNLTIQGGMTLTTAAFGITVTGAAAVAGTIAGGAGALAFYGNVSGGGALTASSGTTTMGGSLGITTFANNGGTAVFNGTSAQSTNGYVFNNLTKSGASTLSVTTSAITVATLTIASASSVVDLGSQNFTIATLVNAGILALDGTQAQTITTMDSAKGIVRYKGAAGGTLRLSSFYNLDVDSASQTFVLNGIAGVNGALTVTAGTLDTNGNALTVLGAVDASGGTLNLGTNGTVHIGGNLSLGTLAWTTGSTVDFNAGSASAQTVRPNGQVFDAVTLNGAAGSRVAWSGTATVGNLTIGANSNFGLDGSVVPGAVTLSVTSGKTITNNGTFSLNDLSHAQVLTLQGTAASATFSGADIAWGGNNLTVGDLVYGPATSLASGTSLSLNNATTMSSALSTISGSTVAVGSNTLTLSADSSFAGTVSIAGPSGQLAAGSNAVTITGTLSFGTANGGSVSCGSFTSSGTVTNGFANTISASGDASFSGAFGGTRTLGTLSMSGAGTTISTAIQIGNLSTSGTATVSATGSALNLAGSLTIATGTSVSLGALGASIGGDATGSGTGTLNGGSAAVSIGGNFGVPTYNASSATTGIAGTTVSFTALTANGGTIDLNGTSGPVALTTGGVSFASLSVSGAGPKTVNATGALITSGNLAIAAGNTLGLQNVAGNSVGGNVSGGGSLNASAIAGANSLTVSGNFTVSGYSAAASATGIAGTTVNFTALTANGGTIDLNGTSGPVALTTGGVSFASLSVSGVGPKTVNATGALITGGNLAIATGNTLVLQNVAGNLVGGNVSGGGSLNASAIAGANSLTVAGYMGTSGNALGDFSAPTSSTVSVGTDWDVASFTVNTGTVAFTGTGTIYTGTTFYNLTKNGGGTTGYNAGIALAVTNNLAVTAGSLALADASGNVGGNVSGGGSLNASVIAGANSLTVSGNFTVSGYSAAASATGIAGTTVSFTALTANGGTIDLNGTSGPVALTTGGVSFAALSVSGAGPKTVNATGALITSGNLAIATGNTLGLQNVAGNLVGGNVSGGGSLNASAIAGANSLTVSGNFAVSGYSAAASATGIAGTTVSFTALTANGGTIDLNGASGPVALTTGGVSFAALSVSGAGPKTVNATGALITSGNLAIAAGNTLGLQNVAGNLVGGNVSGGGSLNASAITGANSLTVAGYMGTNGNALGDFSAPTSSAVSVGTDWDVASFTPNGGTVVFVGAGTIYSGTSFANLTVNHAGSTTANAGLAATGNLALSAGTLAMGAQGLGVEGNITRGAGILTSTGTLTLNGSASAQTADFTGSTLANLTVNNTFGTPTVTLNNTAAFTWTGNLSLIAGTLALANFSQPIGGNVSGGGSLNASAITGANSLTVAGYMGTNGNALGDFSAPTSSAVSVGTDWDVASFTPNGGTVVFVGAGTIYSGTSFANLTVNHAGSTTANAGLAATGNLALSAGTLAMGAQGLGVEGNITRGAGILTSTGTLTLNGSASAQTADFTGSTLANLTVNNTFGTPTVTLNNTAAFTWTGNLSLTAGTLILANLSQTIGGNASGTGGLDASAIAGTNSLTLGGYMGTNLAPVGAVSAPTAAILAVGSDWNVGAFTANGGTVVFRGTGVIYSANTGAGSFNNVTKTTGGSMTAGATIDIANTLTLTAGVFDMASQDFSLGTLVNGTTLELDGAQANQTVTNPDTTSGTVLFKGSLGGAHVGTAGFNAFYDLQVNSTGQSFSLGNAITVARDLTIASGTILDATASNSYGITIGRSWNNSGIFVPETGTVSFATAVGGSVFHINGSTTWYRFSCSITVPNISIEFQRDRTQTILSGGYFFVHANASANTVVVTRDDLGDFRADLDWAPSSTPLPSAALMWQLVLTQSGTAAYSDLQYVDLYYSDARATPSTYDPSITNLGLAITDGSPPGEVADTCYAWKGGVSAIYSYTEDMDHDGKVDRIRVVASSALDGNLGTSPSQFNIAVTGYTVDVNRPGSTRGYEFGGGNTFYIDLVEKPCNDGDARPAWRLVANTVLRSQSTPFYAMNTLFTLMTPTDTVPPVISYTLAVPAFNQVFYGFSEPIYNSSGSPLSLADLAQFPAATTMAVVGSTSKDFGVVTSEGGAIAAPAIASGQTRTLGAGIFDSATPPTDYSLQWTVVPTYPNTPSPPPNSLYSSTHRVSDVMVSVWPSSGVGTWSALNPNSWFVWPIYAKDQVASTLSNTDIAALTPGQTAAQGIGLIRAFDGSQWLRDQNLTLQASVNTAGGLTLGLPSVFYDSNVASTFLGAASGLWLPTHSESSYSGIDGFPNDPSFGGNPGGPAPGSLVSGALYDWQFLASDPKVFSVAHFDFWFRAAGAPADMYAGRLAMPADSASIPANWYRLVRPFSFDIHDVSLQKGGATILNNVIDPTRGETARLSYQLANSGAVTITVFTLDGDVVARLANTSSEAAGDHSAYWNGRNLGGSPVARGLYFIRIVAPGMDEIRKVLVVRK